MDPEEEEEEKEKSSEKKKAEDKGKHRNTFLFFIPVLFRISPFHKELTFSIDLCVV
jgi:hypothetical protein